MTLPTLIRSLLAIAMISDSGTALAQSSPAGRSDVVQPQLVYLGRETYTVGTQRYVRYRFDVANKARFADELFVAAPLLPPCGQNTRASRTWVDFFGPDGRRIYGFCAFQRSADLGTLWFALPEGQAPPQQVYIEMNDRHGNYIYRSRRVTIDMSRVAPAAPQTPAQLVLDRVFMLGRWNMPGQTCAHWIRFEDDNGYTDWRGNEGAWGFGMRDRNYMSARDLTTGEFALRGMVTVVDRQTMTIDGQTLRRCSER